MNFRTTFTIDPSDDRIDYNTPVMFIGSCFATEIGNKMREGRMKTLINPTGVVYNPVSAGNTIDIILKKKNFGLKDLHSFNGMNFSFSHYTDFSSEDPSRVLNKINLSTETAADFLKQARFLFITFGTSRIFRFNETGETVSNCHKIPASKFTREILSVDQIVSAWNEILDRLYSFNPGIRVIFTISPVRHWKDGAHGNQISKSILFLAVEQLLGHRVVSGYFPAYELIMDDLRDYRFYAADMLHLSQAAVSYVWKSFTDCYFDTATTGLWKEAEEINKAMNHRFLSDSASGKKDFAGAILKKISQIEKTNSQIDFTQEKKYFQDLLGE
jgi:hypothetical protein